MGAEIVERVAERVKAAAGVASTPPIDLIRVAGYLGVAEIREIEMVEDGRLEQVEGRSCIYVRAQSARSRKQFTIAHELGHIVLAGRERRLIAHRSAATADPAERFCNQFAAALLIPEHWLIGAGGNREESLAVARQVSRLTGTSLAATVVRLRDVLRWRSSLLNWRRLDGTWRLSSTVGLPHRIHNRITSIAETRDALSMAAGRTVYPACMPLAIEGRQVVMRGELLVTGSSAAMLCRFS